MADEYGLREHADDAEISREVSSSNVPKNYKEIGGENTASLGLKDTIANYSASMAKILNPAKVTWHPLQEPIQFLTAKLYEVRDKTAKGLASASLDSDGISQDGTSGYRVGGNFIISSTNYNPIVLDTLGIYAASVAEQHSDNRYGTTAGLESGQWSSGTTTSNRRSLTAANSLNAIYVPFNMKNISAKIGVRSQASGDPTVWFYTGSRPNGDSAISLGWAASSSYSEIHSGTLNASGYYNIDITNNKAFSVNEGDLIFIYLSNAAENTKTMRATITVYGEIA